ncbi:pyridoxal-phosphate-dependent aminotransferase family protein [Legionella waltersii]|uniref:Purine catabolism protein PucG n=1 Tax=Legionella waltersii TaxID=66969 RepID=A0A0W1A1E1_9GAMM|nr:alanine--glyoxylate aminotransferase family protein [Legionella waltersii]KTD75163.1 Purine catabolism protein PucG [Legionella waltersii]SNV04730.1 Purine catabolism protein PucG [Legionella waltersii]
MHTSFRPKNKLLHGPGPSNIAPRVLHAMAKPTIGHMDPDFVEFMEDLKQMLKSLLQTNNRLTFPISGPGTVGMETCFVNLVEPGDRVVVCVNGVFGGRMVDMVKRIGGVPLVFNTTWGKPIDPIELSAFLEEQSNQGALTILAFVHAETSTGALSDAEAICKLGKQFNALIIMDAVTSVAGVPVRMDEWGVDALYSGTQKCLSAPPGLSPASFNEQALAKINIRKSPVQSWFMDLSLVQQYWDQVGETARTYHHTAPINSLYALHETLIMIEEEGLPALFQRHLRTASILKNGLLELGFSYLVPDKSQMPQLHVVIPPNDILKQEASIRHRLLFEKNIEIGGGLGELAGKVWRIGLMGHSAREENVYQLLSAFNGIKRM